MTIFHARWYTFKNIRRLFWLKIGNFHKGWGFFNMHETKKYAVINNFYFHKPLRCKLFHLATHCIRIMVLPCLMAKQSIEWVMKSCNAT